MLYFSGGLVCGVLLLLVFCFFGQDEDHNILHFPEYANVFQSLLFVVWDDDAAAYLVK